MDLSFSIGVTAGGHCSPGGRHLGELWGRCSASKKYAAGFHLWHNSSPPLPNRVYPVPFLLIHHLEGPSRFIKRRFLPHGDCSRWGSAGWISMDFDAATHGPWTQGGRHCPQLGCWSFCISGQGPGSVASQSRKLDSARPHLSSDVSTDSKGPTAARPCPWAKGRQRPRRAEVGTLELRQV